MVDQKKIRSVVVGIDLGTTNSCVGVYNEAKGEAEIVEIDRNRNSNIIPSIVGFPEDPKTKERSEIPLVGTQAANAWVLNPKGTCYETKRLMGFSLEDIKKKAPEFIKRITYDLVEDENDKNQVKIDIPGLKHRKSPLNIAMHIISAIIAEVEQKLSVCVEKAVITVPAYFDNPQREATRIAASAVRTSSGKQLEVLRLLNEPTAAAVAYGVSKKHKDGLIVVYDMGGGTFDISVVEILGENTFEIKATGGDPLLGGSDFDRRMVEFIDKEIKRTLGITINEESARQRIREAAESAKKTLSAAFEARIHLPFLYADSSGPKHLEATVTRTQFEEMTQDLIERAGGCCKKAISDAKINVSDVREVVMVGGMTRMPKVIEWCESYFKRKPARDVNPDEVVAKGACILAHQLCGGDQDVIILDRTPLSLGIETLGGVFTRIIEANSSMPTKKSQVFSTAQDNQTSVEIKVFQGEREMAQDNKFLGNFSLTGITPAPRSVPQIEVSFDVDENGILEVSAVEKASGKQSSIKVESSAKISEEEIAQMQADAEKFRDKDKDRRELAEQKNFGYSLLGDAESIMKLHQDEVDKEEALKIHSAIQGLREAVSGEDKEKVKAKITELNNFMPKLQELKNAAKKNNDPENDDNKDAKSN